MDNVDTPLKQSGPRNLYEHNVAPLLSGKRQVQGLHNIIYVPPIQAYGSNFYPLTINGESFFSDVTQYKGGQLFCSIPTRCNYENGPFLAYSYYNNGSHLQANYKIWVLFLAQLLKGIGFFGFFLLYFQVLFGDFMAVFCLIVYFSHRLTAQAFDRKLVLTHYFGPQQFCYKNGSYFCKNCLQAKYGSSSTGNTIEIILVLVFSHFTVRIGHISVKSAYYKDGYMILDPRRGLGGTHVPNFRSTTPPLDFCVILSLFQIAS